MRVAALVVLVLLLGVVLRARIPGAPPLHSARPADNPAALLGLGALAAASMLVFAVAIVASLRDSPQRKPAPRYDVPGSGGARGRRSWRPVLIAVAVLLAWLVVVALLAQLRLPQYRGGPPEPSAAKPGAHDGNLTPPPAGPSGGDHIDWHLTVSTAVLVVLILVATVLVRIRLRRFESSAPPIDDGPARTIPQPGGGSLAVAAQRGLAEVEDLSREPRGAIIACYAAMEQALVNAPGAAPQESDTPSEVLARAVQHEAIRADSAAELVALFAEARFSTHMMNEGHREAAERALRLVLDELRSPA